MVNLVSRTKDEEVVYESKNIPSMYVRTDKYSGRFGRSYQVISGPTEIEEPDKDSPKRKVVCEFCIGEENDVPTELIVFTRGMSFRFCQIHYKERLKPGLMDADIFEKAIAASVGSVSATHTIYIGESGISYALRSLCEDENQDKEGDYNYRMTVSLISQPRPFGRINISYNSEAYSHVSVELINKRLSWKSEERDSFCLSDLLDEAMDWIDALDAGMRRVEEKPKLIDIEIDPCSPIRARRKNTQLLPNMHSFLIYYEDSYIGDLSINHSVNTNPIKVKTYFTFHNCDKPYSRIIEHDIPIENFDITQMVSDNMLLAAEVLGLRSASWLNTYEDLEVMMTDMEATKAKLEKLESDFVTQAAIQLNGIIALIISLQHKFEETTIAHGKAQQDSSNRVLFDDETIAKRTLILADMISYHEKGKKICEQLTTMGLNNETPFKQIFGRFLTSGWMIKNVNGKLQIT